MHILRTLLLLLSFVVLVGAHATGAQQVTMRLRRGPAVAEGFAACADGANGATPWREGDALTGGGSREPAAVLVALAVPRREELRWVAIATERRCWAEAARRALSSPAYGDRHEPPLCAVMFGIDAPRLVPLMLFG